MVRRPKLVAVRFTEEEIAEMDAACSLGEYRSEFIRVAVRQKIERQKGLVMGTAKPPLDNRAVGDNEIIRMPARRHVNASGQRFPGSFVQPTPKRSGQTATAKGRPRAKRKCRHGAEEGYNCGLCGGLAVME
jgi:Arc/MetJ-type ribon-helix-helix transcriptional regulator